MRNAVVLLALSLCAHSARADLSAGTALGSSADDEAEALRVARRWLQAVARGRRPRELRELPGDDDRMRLKRFAAQALRSKYQDVRRADYVDGDFCVSVWALVFFSSLNDGHSHVFELYVRITPNLTKGMRVTAVDLFHGCDDDCPDH